MKISIIVPTLNEAKTIRRTLEMLDNLEGDKEIIVVDGGSSDNTMSLAAEKTHVLLLSAPMGRASQMNHGAKNAAGDVLFFLHSDSLLQHTAIKSIAETMQDPLVVGGCFTLEMDDTGLLFKIISVSSNIRARYSRIYFGDQGIFVRKDVFEKLGGYPQIDLMEDWEFSRALRKTGRVVQLPDKIITSSRRFKKGGVLKTCLLMHKLKLLYILGVSPRYLKKRYYKEVD
ncbi:TIGR04283 family arsenosugar biosynthesis glycosyltransferase [Desulfitibacter alkalitolerans]|uniref:TIGR04283 family arsenosugar biosynthesis glycosyltransferase n=1 Tax=Desulfitibacter alkalitolerans TaxID=264641 RepID=UPI0004876B69|nr:TIGR04283 family arsenosugar biosynthesis glycosyltransferase [Desulfitibacter alkalitolerans]